MDFRDTASQIITDIDRAMVTTNEPRHRNHLGASDIGDDCLRRLWYKFRWMKLLRFNGRMLRLFQRGHNEERVFANLLRRAGWGVVTEDQATGEQYRFSSLDGHFCGSMDGIGYPPAHLNLPDRVLLEFKTANKARSGKLMKNGVKEEMPKHWAQQHLYGAAHGCTVACYISVNKDNDDLHCEVFSISEAIATDMHRKAEAIIRATEKPPGISSDSTFWICRFCDYKQLCYESAAPDANCRSCKHSRPGPNAMWRCTAHGDVEIPKDKIGLHHPCWESAL